MTERDSRRRARQPSRASLVAAPLAALALLALACTRPPAPAPRARVVRDSLGLAVRLPGEVRRVVSLAPSSTEILYAVGAGALVVGVDRYSDWPAAARAVPRVGGDLDPSVERIVALRPDVVLLATSANGQSTRDALRQLGIPCYVSRSDSLVDVYRDIEAIGEVVGRGDAARRLAAGLRARIDAVARRTAGSAVRAAVVVWSEPLVVAGPSSHVGEMLRAAGGDNAAADASQPFPTYSVERLIARAPAVIIVGTHADHAPPMTPLTRLTTIPAVRDGRVYAFDGDLLFRAGPRIADGVEALAALLHPPGR